MLRRGKQTCTSGPRLNLDKKELGGLLASAMDVGLEDKGTPVEVERAMESMLTSKSSLYYIEKI